MPSSDERTNLRPDYQRLIRRMAEHYAPAPLSAARQATFDRTLEERLADSSQSSFLRPAGLLIPVCAALLLWFAPPYFSNRTPPASTPLAWDAAATKMPVQDTTSHSTLLAYAYNQSEAQEEFLPAEYLALADAFDLL